MSLWLIHPPHRLLLSICLSHLISMPSACFFTCSLLPLICFGLTSFFFCFCPWICPSFWHSLSLCSFLSRLWAGLCLDHWGPVEGLWFLVFRWQEWGRRLHPRCIGPGALAAHLLPVSLWPKGGFFRQPANHHVCEVMAEVFKLHPMEYDQFTILG